MKIALVAPSPAPFVVGGAENLWTGWLAALNAQPGVEADLIKLPSPERGFWEIIDSYRRFAELDLLHFDRVISAKYPGWMVAHPDHHLYLLHKLRGLYDTWPSGLDGSAMPDAPLLERLMRVLARSRGARSALPEILGALEDLRREAPNLTPALFTLPGLLIRRVVHALDAIGTAPGAVRRYVAISATVRGRADYFPPGVAVEVLHPPAVPRPAPSVQPGVPGGAVFAASRLDGPKRMDWVLQAYLEAGLEVPLLIAGDGPQRERLEALAAGHPRIQLVGRLTDAELMAAYARALFVVFVPDREDYGLVALEALQSGTPVLTCADAGGVTELVRHEENGLVTEASVPALARGMRRLTDDRALRERLARHARASVSHIQWPAFARAFSRPWPRVAVVNTFGIFPPCNGGQVRMFHLYRRLARWANLRVVNLGQHDVEPETRLLAPGLTEVLVPMSEAHAAFESDLSEELGASCSDVAAMLRPDLTPDWLVAIREATTWADLVIACHPYGFPAIRSVWSGPVVYESLNVEADLKAAIFGHAQERLEAVARVEADCARQAPLVLCCSHEDAARMRSLYGLGGLPVVVPNGVDAASYAASDAETRVRLRERMGVGQTRLALFVGSLHGPNLDAVAALTKVAPDCPDVLFCVLGSVCETVSLPQDAANVRLIGRVSDAELRVWLAVADVGLNPMVTGSGTNLKLLEYAAAGLPILSTPFGARGGVLMPGTHLVQAELEDFASALVALLGPEAEAERQARAERARVRASEAGDWAVIAERMWEAIAPRQHEADPA